MFEKMREAAMERRPPWAGRQRRGAEMARSVVRSSRGMRSRWRRAVRNEPAPAERRVRAVSWTGLAGAGSVVGAGVMYFFDPAQGRRRRAQARDRSFAAVRHGGRRLGKTARRRLSDLAGYANRLGHWRPGEAAAPNDAALVQRVQSVVFRDRDLAKGRINVNAEDGVVVLRGALDRPEQIRELEDKVRQVDGVTDVKSHLHLPHTPAPDTGASRTS